MSPVSFYISVTVAVIGFGIAADVLYKRTSQTSADKQRIRLIMTIGLMIVLFLIYAISERHP